MRGARALSYGVFAASAVAGLVWLAIPGRVPAPVMSHAQPKIVVQKPAPIPVEHSAPMAARPVVLPARKLPHEHAKLAQSPKESTPDIRIGNFLTEVETGEPVTERPKAVVAKAESAKQPDGIGFNVGRELPWPNPDNGWISPKNRDVGFHVGVNLRLDQNWDFTGLAGVKMPGGIDTFQVKPVIDQIGIQARYRF